MKFEDLATLRPDLAFIAHWVPEKAHVLDVGCGDGAMLRYLESGKQCTGYGIELADEQVLKSTARGINVNGIAPTVVLTEAAEKWRTDEQRWNALLARIPLGRVAQPADIVGATIFFCSPASDFVTGQVLYLDGGITASQ